MKRNKMIALSLVLTMFFALIGPTVDTSAASDKAKKTPTASSQKLELSADETEKDMDFFCAVSDMIIANEEDSSEAGLSEQENWRGSYGTEGKKNVEETSDNGELQAANNSVSSEASSGSNYDFSTKRLIVRIKDGYSFNPEYWKPVDYVESEDGLYVLQFATKKRTQKVFEKLSTKKKVEYVDVDTKLDSGEPQEASSMSNASWNVSALGADSFAKRLLDAGYNNEIIVAVVDTGVDYTHTDLSNRMYSKGYDFVNNDKDAYDDESHGTHVAGIVVETTPGLNVKILPVKALNRKGEGTSITVSNAIIWAAEQGADIINLSLSGASYGTNHYEDEAIAKAISLGATVVVAAGNSGSNTAYECPAHNTSAIVVGAVDSSFKRESYSNYGSSLDVMAPGNNIYSTVPGNSYEWYSGTSMAAPHIAGVCAMYKMMYPDANASQIETLLKTFTTDLGDTGYDIYYGYGIPNMSLIKNIGDGSGIPSTTPTATPTATPTPSPSSGPGMTPAPSPTPSDGNGSYDWPWDDSDWPYGGYDWGFGDFDWGFNDPGYGGGYGDYPGYGDDTGFDDYGFGGWTYEELEEIFGDLPFEYWSWLLGDYSGWGNIPTNTPTAAPTTTPTTSPTATPTSSPAYPGYPGWYPTVTPTTSPTYGNVSMGLSTSSSSMGYRKTIQIVATTSSPVGYVEISINNGERYRFTQTDYYGQCFQINFETTRGASFTGTVEAYDYQNNKVASSRISF